MVTSLLHDVDLILGINWLEAVNPLVDWSSSRIFLPKEVGASVLPSSWIDQAQKIGTIKVLQDAIALAALWDIQVEQQISLLASPQFWNYRVTDARRHHFFRGRINH